MRFSDITVEGWAPDTHFFTKQYEILAKIVKETPIEKVYDKLDRILTPNSDGICWYRKRGENIRFHPVVVQRVRRIIE